MVIAANAVLADTKPLDSDPDPAMHLDSDPDTRYAFGFGTGYKIILYVYVARFGFHTIKSTPCSNLSTFRFNFQDGTCMPANYYIFLLQKPPNKIRLRIRNRKTSLDTDFSARKLTRHIGYTLNQYGLINKKKNVATT